MKKMIVAIWCMLAMNSWALYYGVPYAIEGDNLGGVTIQNGETPFPADSVYPVPIELRSRSSIYLKVVDGKLVEKSAAEKTFVDTPIKYKKQVGGLWVEMSAEEKRLVDLPSKYKNPDGSEMTPEQKAAVDAAEEAAAEKARQDAKTLALKTIENSFLSMCDQLTGQTTHAKLTFVQIRTIIGTLSAEQQVLLAVQLLIIDAEAKREGGNLWWDTCAWHTDI